MGLRTLIATTIALLAATAIVGATAIHVPDDEPTIQSGIDAASAGDTVLVDCGVYYEHDITMRPGVCLRSVTGSADCVTIDALEQGRVMLCQGGDKETILSGLTLTGGLATYRGHERQAHLGGGLYCPNSLDGPKVVECVFLENDSTRNGGGVHCGTSGTPVFRRCAFVRNWALNHGGGVYSTMGLGDQCAPSFEDCVFEGNEAAELGGGCCLYTDGGAILNLVGCEFIMNVAGGSGGALHVVRSHLTVDGCLFVGNSASYIGGALRVYHGESAELTGCTMVGNDAMQGSAVHTTKGDVDVDRSLVVFGLGGAAASCSVDGGVAFSCSNVYRNEGGDWVGCVEGQNLLEGNISTDPFFCGEQHPDLPYSIRLDSPCAPDGNECGVLIGARGVGCGPTAVRATTWGKLKALYR